MFEATVWVILLKQLAIVQLKSLEADLDRTANVLSFTDKSTGGVGVNNKSHWRSVFDDEDECDPAHVERKRPPLAELGRVRHY